MSTLTLSTSTLSDITPSVSALAADVTQRLANRETRTGSAVLPSASYYACVCAEMNGSEVEPSCNCKVQPPFNIDEAFIAYFAEPSVQPSARLIDLCAQYRSLPEHLHRHCDELEAAPYYIDVLQRYKSFVAARLHEYYGVINDFHELVCLWLHAVVGDSDAVRIAHEIRLYGLWLREHRRRLYSAVIEECDTATCVVGTEYWHVEEYRTRRLWECPWCKLAFLDCAACDFERITADLSSLRFLAEDRVDGGRLLSDYWKTVRGQCSMAWKLLDCEDLDIGQGPDQLVCPECEVCRNIVEDPRLERFL